jgi:hypothetical protein
VHRFVVKIRRNNQFLQGGVPESLDPLFVPWLLVVGFIPSWFAELFERKKATKNNSLCGFLDGWLARVPKKPRPFRIETKVTPAVWPHPRIRISSALIGFDSPPAWNSKSGPRTRARDKSARVRVAVDGIALMAPGPSPKEYAVHALARPGRDFTRSVSGHRHGPLALVDVLCVCSGKIMFVATFLRESVTASS